MKTGYLNNISVECRAHRDKISNRGRVFWDSVKPCKVKQFMRLYKYKNRAFDGR